VGPEFESQRGHFLKILMSLEKDFLESAKKLFRYYKGLGEKAIAQLDDKQVLSQPNDASNSIALIVHHLSGNMLSRCYADKKAMMEAWEKGWSCLFNALDSLQPEDLSKIIYIRNEGQSVMEAIQRQLAHYPSHVGQIIYQAKILKGQEFQSLSIPKGGSGTYNQSKFQEEKGIRHFTDKV
jgi:hypothetical protein